jgi:hypothetical protein
MTRLGSLVIVLSMATLGDISCATAAQESATPTNPKLRAIPLVATDDTFALRSDAASRSFRGTSPLRINLVAPAPGVTSASQPSFTEMVLNGPTYSTVTPTVPEQRSEFPTKSWGHVLVGLGMMLFVALRRLASL